MQEESRFKRNIAAICAILMAIVFLVSGAWKVLRPFRAGELLEQAQVPSGFGVLGAVTLGTLEVFIALLLLMPQFRRWGGLLGSALMIFFIAWIARYYHVLVGHECNCFPIIKRTVGPGFFIGDGIMLLLTLIAFAWSPRVVSRITRVRVPAFTLIALVVFAGASYGYNVVTRAHAQVPVPVIVNGHPEDLSHGKVFLFFYDPSCEHCDAASRFMSTLNWGDTKVVAIPTVNPQWAASFLHDTKLNAGTSLELAKLKGAFPFGDPPFGVALEDGQVRATFTQAQFNPPLPSPDLKKLGFLR